MAVLDLSKLRDAILSGDAPTAVATAGEALEAGVPPIELITKTMIPAMDEAGRLFEAEEYFVPELLLAARAMKAALEIATAQGGENLGFPILPRIGGPSIVRIGKSKPHQYWARYWIQLYLEIVGWLDPEEQDQARTRLSKLKVEYRS